MTTSKALVFHSGKHTLDETVLIDIYENLPIDEPYSHGVCVCPVPKSFLSAKSEAITPHFVGLGPYHHFGPNLPMTDKLKLGVAKRVLKVPRIREAHQRLQNSVLDGEIQAFYHMDDYHNTCDSPTLLYVLTVDSLFLLGLLHNDTNLEQRYFSCYVLTGNHYRTPPVNAAGVALSMDGIIRDVFMLENQIPTFVLKQINEVNNINIKHGIEYSSDEELGSIMLNFCRAYSPLAINSRPSKDPVAHHHLLDLMYFLIAPEPQRKPHLHRYSCCQLNCVMGVAIYLFCLFCFNFWAILWILAYVVVVIVQPFLQLIRFVLVKVIPWSGAILEQPKIEFPTLRYFFHAVGDLYFCYIFRSKMVFTLPLRYLAEQLEEIDFPVLMKFSLLILTGRYLLYSSYATTVPSATELHNYRIQFKPFDGDISSIKFDEKRGEFYLPHIKLDATSEVILRNLAVYESSVKIGRFNFSSYIELMSALIHTDEDVKLLINERIIETQLSVEEVTQIFKMPMGESTGRRTDEIRELEVRLMDVKPKFDAINNLYLILTEFMRVCAICGVVVVFSPLLAQAFQKIWCSTIFGNSSESYCNGNRVGDYGRNNYNISSM